MKITSVKTLFPDGGQRVFVFVKVETDQPGPATVPKFPPPVLAFPCGIHWNRLRMRARSIR